MKKKEITEIIIGFVIVCAIFAVSFVTLALNIFASDITDAQYYGTIVVTNNGTATTEVSTNMSLSTQESIDAGWIDSDCERVAIRNASGADVPFMPAQGSGMSWILWVPSIGDSSQLNYILYTGNSSLDSVKYYFPGPTGMSVSDNANLELGDNFTVEINGYFTIDEVSDNIVSKPASFHIYPSASGNISAFARIASYTWPTSHSDPSSVWTNETYAYDNNTATHSYTSGNGWLYLTPASPVESDLIFLYADSNDPGDPVIKVQVEYDGDWTQILWDSVSKNVWTTIPVGSVQDISEVRITYPPSNTFELCELVIGDGLSVEAGSGIPDGYYQCITRANGTLYELLFDSGNIVWNSDCEVGDPTTGFTSSYSTISRETSPTPPVGSYIMKIQCNDAGGGNPSLAYQEVSNYLDYASANVTIGAWCYAPSSNDKTQTLSISDGAGPSTSTQIPKDDSWHWLTATHEVDNSPSYLRARVLTKTELDADTDDVAYIDGIKLVEGNSCSADDYPVATVALSGASVHNSNYDWRLSESSIMPYVANISIEVGGVQRGYWEWENNTTFSDQSGNGNTATPTFRTSSSSENVSAELVSFQPVETARAPGYTVSDAPPFITENASAADNFTYGAPDVTEFPGKAVGEAVAESGETPSQLFWGIISGFTIVLAGLFITWIFRNYGGRSVLFKILCAVFIMAIFVAIGTFDWWMLVMYVMITAAIAMWSKHIDWGGTGVTTNWIGFLAFGWVGLTTINRILEGQFISSSETSFLNNLMFTQTFDLFGMFSIPIINMEFFTEGIPRLVMWDYSFFGGNAQLFQYLLYSITAVVSFIMFALIIGLLYNFFSRLR